MFSRFVIGCLLTALAMTPIRGSDDELKAKAALALAFAKPPAAAALKKHAECGTCRTDLDAVREDCKKTGKPFLIFVGGCYGRSAEFAKAEAEFVRIDSYPNDDLGSKPRIVVVGRKGDTGELRIVETLAVDAKASAVKAALKDAKDGAVMGPPKAVAPVNWLASNQVASPYQTFLITGGSCPGGNCPLRK